MYGVLLMDQAQPAAGEALRIEGLHGMLWHDAASDPASDALARCAARLAECPVALVCLVDGDRLWFKARVGLEQDHVLLQSIPCFAQLRSDELIEIHDTSVDARFRDTTLIAEAPQLRFCALVPLRADGVCVGLLCVMDDVPRHLTPVQRDGLNDLAQVLRSMLAQQHRIAELEASERRLLDFSNASGDWLWETDAEHRYTWLSKPFEAATGLTIAQQLGSHPPRAELLDWEGGKVPGEATFLDLLEARASFSRAVVCKTTPLGPRYVSYSAQAMQAARGEFNGFRGVARDITQRIESELRDRHTFETLQSLAQHVPGVIYQFERRADGSTAFPYASEGLRRVFELGPEQVQDDAAPWFERIHPEDRATVHQAIAASAQGEQPWSQSWRVVLPTQGLRVLDNVASPTRRPDGSVLWHGFVTDVTEQQQVADELARSGQQWALASEAASIGIFEFDPSSSSVRLDHHACALHGLVVPAGTGGGAGASVGGGVTLVFAQWLDLLSPESREPAKAYLAAVSAASAAQREVLLTQPSEHEPRGLEFVVRALPGTVRHGGQVLRGVCRDVTEQLAVDRLRQEVSEALQSSRSKSEFLSRVSHELRTPLNGILGFAQLLESDGAERLTHTQLQRVQTIRMSGNRLLSLVNDVLELSKIEQKTFSFQVESVALGDVIANCVAMVQPLALERVVHLRVDPGIEKWVVKADRRALDQIVLNLLSNAIKYNRHGGHVRIGADSKVRGRVQISFEDSGLGMTTQQTANLFQPFNRVGAEHTPTEGTGLGLVIARELVLGLRGTLDVKSTPGRGSCFTVSLPQGRMSARAAVRSSVPPPGEAQQSDWVAALGATALYIEDDPVNMALMEAIFAQLGGWQLWTATTGEAGLLLALQHRPSLVLTDMNLPDMQGLEIVRELRRQAATRGVRIVAVSADAMPEQVALARANGVDDYWTKPLDVSLIRRRLNSFLSGNEHAWADDAGQTITTTASGVETLGD